MTFTKNPAYKSINSSSMRFLEEPKVVKVLPPKNPGYKNVNSSSMIYVEPNESNNIVPVTTNRTWSQTCTIY
jgi:hypothetical protein